MSAFGQPSTHPVRNLLLGMLLGVASLAAHAAWTVSVVDGNGDVGHDSSIQLNGSNPVVAYWDETNADLRLATCTSGCTGSTPTWVVTTIDSVGDVGAYASLQLNGGNPVVSYRDRTNGALKLATCIANCGTVAPTWIFNTVDRGSPDVGLFTSLQLNEGKPVVAYRDFANGDLKLATCTAGCATTTPTWVISTVDSFGNVGRSASLQLKDGRPIVSYYDVTNLALKLATCTSGCATAAPTWVITRVDSASGEDVRFSMQIDGAGKPIVSYYDAGRLKLATCAADCETSAPTWILTTIEAGTLNMGLWSSLQLSAGKPVVAYFAEGRLKLAACRERCDTATPVWDISFIDETRDTGWYPSLQIGGHGNAFMSYYDFTLGALKLAVGPLAGALNYQGLWWKSPPGSESGWGVNLTHQGNILFATWFTYDLDGSGMWLVMSNGVRTGDGAYSGTLFRTTGPAFNNSPWDRAQVGLTAVGTAGFAFSDHSTGLFTYTVNGISQSKTITRQIFANPNSECVAGGTPGPSPNFQDLWWNSPAGSESGWGVNLTHQGDILFATWFTYGADGKGLWLVMSNGVRTALNTYTGTLFRTTGPAFNTTAWNPANVVTTPVGVATFSFDDSNNGVFAYSVQGVSQTKPIMRQAFSTPLTVCR